MDIDEDDGAIVLTSNTRSALRCRRSPGSRGGGTECQHRQHNRSPCVSQPVSSSSSAVPARGGATVCRRPIARRLGGIGDVKTSGHIQLPAVALRQRHDSVSLFRLPEELRCFASSDQKIQLRRRVKLRVLDQLKVSQGGGGGAVP